MRWSHFHTLALLNKLKWDPWHVSLSLSLLPTSVPCRFLAFFFSSQVKVFEARRRYTQYNVYIKWMQREGSKGRTSTHTHSTCVELKLTTLETLSQVRINNLFQHLCGGRGNKDIVTWIMHHNRYPCDVSLTNSASSLIFFLN